MIDCDWDLQLLCDKMDYTIIWYAINMLTATYPYAWRIDFVGNLPCIHFSGDLIILDLEGVFIWSL